jgi:hypothetical protein
MKISYVIANGTSVEEVVDAVNQAADPALKAAEYAYNAALDNRDNPGGEKNMGSLEFHLDCLIDEGGEFDINKACEYLQANWHSTKRL